MDGKSEETATDSFPAYFFDIKHVQQVGSNRP